MSGYVLLILRGGLLDALEGIFVLAVAMLSMWRRAMSGKDTSTTRVVASSKRVGPNIWTGWVVFYTRRLYSRIEDCWNRPITGEASSSLQLCVRKRVGFGDGAPLRMTGATQRCLNLGSYNYLGFGGVEQHVTPFVIDALREHGSCSGSSRAEAGDTHVHRELESAVAAFLDKPAAIIIGMGFATNSTLIPAMVDPSGRGKGVLIVSDSLNHSSIVEGVRGSGARVQPFAHNDMSHLDSVLRRATQFGQADGTPWRKIIIMVEGIYSMEGQFCRLREIVALKKKYRAYLYLDEAHSIGAVGPRGRGVTDYLGVPTSEVDVMMGTFTKSFGSVGGYVAASAELVAQLRRHASASLYAPAMSVPATQQALSALRVIMGDNKSAGDLGQRKIAQLRRNSNLFRKGLLEMGCRVLGDIDSPVIPIMLYHPEKICNFSRACLRRGLAVVVVGFPATPLLLSRARFCIAASHTEEELRHALTQIKAAAQEVGVLYDRGTSAATDAAATRRHHELLTASMDAEPQTDWYPEPLAAHAHIGVSFAPRTLSDVKLDANTVTSGPIDGADADSHTTTTTTKKKTATDTATDTARDKVTPSAAPSTAPFTTPSTAAGPAAVCVAADAADGQRVLPSLDLRRSDFARLGAASAPRAAAEEALRKYGCGTCGPRGFYGTLDVHLELEAKLAYFLGTDNAIVYSFGVATISSVVPAFVRKGDLLFVDEGVHFCAAVGVRLARGEARKFAHNSVSALEEQLKAQAATEDLRNTPASKRPRRFVLVEGLYANSGDIAPLVELLRLRDVYGFYLIVDDTLGFGTLGATGRGAAEACGVPSKAIDVLVGSLEHSLGSVGGFCAGSTQIVGHQRLSGSGYCFSASLPAYATVQAIAALELLQAEPERLTRVSAASAAMHAALSDAMSTAGGGAAARAGAEAGMEAGEEAGVEAGAAHVVHLQVLSNASSPIAHVRLSARARSVLPTRKQEALLLSAARRVHAQTGAAVQLMRHSGLAHVQTPQPPSLRLAVHADADRAAFPAVATALVAALGAELALEAALASCKDSIKDGAKEWPAVSSRQLSSVSARTLSPSSSSGMLSELVQVEEQILRVEAKALKSTDEVPVVTLPLIQLLELVRRTIRQYIQRQMEWHVRAVLPALYKFRAARSPAMHALSELGMLLGSESFYFVVIPILSWSASNRAAVPMFVAFFAANLYMGNWLKNLFTLPRPSGGTRDAATLDFGWPSLYAVNAVGLPFFAMRYWYGGFGTGTPFSASFPFTTALSYTLAFLWVLLICGARLYSGSSSPADVQGGMLVGGVLVRAWLPFSDCINDWIVGHDSQLWGLPQWAVLLLLSTVLLLIHPFTPNEPRSWTAFGYSVKAVVFGTSFILGSNYCAHSGCTNNHVALDTVPCSAAVLAKLAARNLLGFAMLATCWYIAGGVSRRVTRSLSDEIQKRPCTPMLVRHTLGFATIGVCTSLGAPMAFRALGI